MRETPPPPRTTTTPLRKAKAPSTRLPLLALVTLAVAFSVAALAAFGASSGSPQGEQESNACQGASCNGPSFEARPVAASIQSSPPCAYCNQDANRWRAFTSTPPPEIGGESAVVIEASCGKMLYGFNENERRAPASLTKIAAAMVAVKQARLTDMVDIKINGWDLSADDNSTIMGLEAGMRLSVEDLVYGMMLVSGNDAALALAEHLGGASRFVGLMNDEARRLGLANTHFVTPDGRDAPAHYSTTLDMALFGRALLQDPLLNKVVNTQKYTPRWNGRTLWNNNEMIYAYTDAVGVKIGYTEAAEFTIVTGVERGGRLLIASVFGSWNLYWDPVRLLDWAFENTTSSCA